MRYFAYILYIRFQIRYIRFKAKWGNTLDKAHTEGLTGTGMGPNAR